jgi:uncharacterized protein YijF (DUF1287 family)
LKKPQQPKSKARRGRSESAAAARKPGAARKSATAAKPAAKAKIAGPRATRRTAIGSDRARLPIDPFASFTGFARRVPQEFAAALGRFRTEARAAALSYSPDEREALALLFLPFLLFASAIVIHQSVRNLGSYLHVVAVETELAPIPSSQPDRRPFTGLPQATAREAAPERVALAPVPGESDARPSPHAGGPLLETLAPDRSLRSVAPGGLRSRTARLHLLSPERAPQSAIPETSGESRVAALTPLAPSDIPRSVAPDSIEALEMGKDGKPVPGICVAEAQPAPSAQAADTEANRSLTPEAFGLRLAEAAQSQVGAFVVYNDSYRSISYPMGDVPPFFGVCTDVVIRAYRALGFDLQALVHQARSGGGDTSIDHRRTEILRRFFAREGESLPVTSFAEDYRPGDIVTYYRPQNRRSRTHIAIVSAVVAPSGRPMIIHNRGWGPALEDALFVDEITGHYRYRGPKSPPVAERAPREAVNANAPALPGIGKPASSVVTASVPSPAK